MLKKLFLVREHDGTKEMDGLAGALVIMVVVLSYFYGFNSIEPYYPLQMIFLYTSGYALAKNKNFLFVNDKYDINLLFGGIKTYLIYPVILSGILGLLLMVLKKSTISLNEITRNLFMIYLFNPISLLMGMGLAYFISKLLIITILKKYGIKKGIIISSVICVLLQFFRWCDLSSITYLFDKKFTNCIVSFILGFLFYYLLKYLKRNEKFQVNAIGYTMILFMVVVIKIIHPEEILWKNGEVFIWLMVSPAIIMLTQDFFVINLVMRNVFLVYIGERFFWIVTCYYSIYQLICNFGIQIDLWKYVLIVLLSYLLSNWLFRLFSNKLFNVSVIKNNIKKDSITLKGWSYLQIESIEIMAGGLLIGEACTGMFRKDLFEKTGKKQMAFLWEGNIDDDNDLKIYVKFKNGNRVVRSIK